MKPIFLIGFMGSGKSTVGKELANVLRRSFVDLDSFIEEKHQTKISDIFTKHGEETFRKYESESLKDVSTFEVIATGGGIVEKMENIQTMKDSGTIIYLQATFEEIINRLKEDNSRPLWEGDLEGRKALYDRRVLLYDKYANTSILTNNKEIEKIVAEIEKMLQES